MRGCIFCDKPAANDDAGNFIVYRGRFNFIILNAFPYTSWHIMIVPYQHAAGLHDLPQETLSELMALAKAAEERLRAVYKPEGLNMGINIGKCAGAGIADHVHMHVLPRWVGDANFMTTVGETRVMPEALDTTYEKLSRAFRDYDGAPAE